MENFRSQFIDFGGDGIYAAWALLYQETVFASELGRSGVRRSMTKSITL